MGLSAGKKLEQVQELDTSTDDTVCSRWAWTTKILNMRKTPLNPLYGGGVIRIQLLKQANHMFYYWDTHQAQPFIWKSNANNVYRYWKYNKAKEFPTWAQLYYSQTSKGLVYRPCPPPTLDHMSHLKQVFYVNIYQHASRCCCCCCLVIDGYIIYTNCSNIV